MFQSKIISFLANWHLVFMIAGYAFFTSLFAPVIGTDESSSRLITLPYRALILSISLLLILNTFKQKRYYSADVKWIIFFFILHFIRFFFDLELRDNFFTTDSKILYYTFLIFVTFFPFYATIMSIKYIDFKKVALYSLILTTVTMLLSIFLNSGEQETDRLSGNLALNPISYGQAGAFGIVLTIYFLMDKQKKHYFFKFFLVLSLILGFVTLGRAASRGPLLGLIVCFLFYVYAKQKKPFFSIFFVTILIFIIYISQDFLVKAIGAISPTLESRVLDSLREGDSSGRDEFFLLGWQQFLENPIIGDYFVLYPENGKGINSHSIIIDAFMSFGFFGGILLIYLFTRSLIFASKLIKQREIIWVSQFLVISIIGSLFSSSFYTNSILPTFMAFIFIYIQDRNQFRNYLK